MATIDTEIIINAPLEKIFRYVSKPSNLPQIWPSVIEIKNEQLLPNGGYSAQWVYKMAEKYLEGTGEYTAMVPNQWFTIKTKGAVDSTITMTFRYVDSKTRVTLTINYRVPSAILGWLARRIILKMNEQEADLVLANLRAILEES